MVDLLHHRKWLLLEAVLFFLYQFVLFLVVLFLRSRCRRITGSAAYPAAASDVGLQRLWTAAN